MVMGDRAAAANDRVARRLLDSMPLRLELAVPPQCMKREIGRRAVGIDMRETAGDLARPAGRLADARPGRFLDGIMKRLEALPGDRRLKGVGDNSAPDQRLAGIRQADEGVAPDTGGTLPVGVGCGR